MSCCIIYKRKNIYKKERKKAEIIIIKSVSEKEKEATMI